MATIKSRLKLRVGSAAAWANADPILLEGEPGLESDTGRLRFGDGGTPFTSLPYLQLSLVGPQAYSEVLSALDGLSGGANKLPYFTGAKSMSQADLTPFGRQIIGSADSAAAWALVLAEASNSFLAKTGGALDGGFTATDDAEGIIAPASTYKPTPAGGNFKALSNGGAFTLLAPDAEGSYSLCLDVLNIAGAGTITFSGFTKVAGDSITTTVNHKFQFHISKTSRTSLINVVALQ